MTTTVGILYPGHSAEDDFATLAALLGPGVALPVQHTQMDEDAHRLDALLDWGRDDRLADGAAQQAAGLAPDARDAVVWACTSGSFAYGWDGAHRQAAALAAAAAVPASSTSLAFVAAARSLGLHRVAIVATYPPDVTALFGDFLRAAGLEVVDTTSQDVYTAAEVGTLGRATVLDIASAGDRPDAEAVLMPDTALHTAEHLDALEQRVGKPVLTANQVSAWEGLRLAGHDLGHPDGPAGLGTLFARSPTHAGDAPPATESRR